MSDTNRLICYDISDKSRLAKVAKYLEKVAFRIQYSIFLLPSPKPHELDNIINKLTMLINQQEDDLKIYKITSNGYHFANATDLNHPFILLS